MTSFRPYPSWTTTSAPVLPEPGGSQSAPSIVSPAFVENLTVVVMCLGSSVMVRSVAVYPGSAALTLIPAPARSFRVFAVHAVHLRQGTRPGLGVLGARVRAPPTTRTPERDAWPRVTIEEWICRLHSAGATASSSPARLRFPASPSGSSG